MECLPLSSLKFNFEELIEWNSKFKCPTCSNGGQKDDGCTHMNDCLCGVDWCYFCQHTLPLNNSEHNSNWYATPPFFQCIFVTLDQAR